METKLVLAELFWQRQPFHELTAYNKELLALLEEGWRVAHVRHFGTRGRGDKQVFLFVLERPPKGDETSRQVETGSWRMPSSRGSSISRTRQARRSPGRGRARESAKS